MKNSKLIEILKTYNPNANVTTTIAEDITISYITGNNQYNKNNTPQIFIEPIDCINCTQYDTCENHDTEICEKFTIQENST